MELAREMGLDVLVTQAIGIVAADMDGEKVMLNIDDGKYFGMDSIGSRIWELIERQHSVRDVVRLLQKDYEVDEKTCQDDTLTFLSILHTKGLVTID